MKRILFASWYSGLGGGETDLLSLIDALDETEYECQLLLPAEGKLAEHWRARGGRTHIIPYRGATTYFVPAIWSRFPIVRRIAQLLSDERIDLVHSDYHTLPLMAPAAQRGGHPDHVDSTRLVVSAKALATRFLSQPAGGGAFKGDS